MRDTQLDCYRGLAMIYVVCFIHVLYWQDMPLPYKSYFLVEMPVIFFIAGASFRLSAPKGDKALVVSRFKRVFWPYFKYAFLSIALFGFYFYSGDFARWLHYDALKDILLGIGITDIPYVYHTWFILPYFILSASSNRLFAWVNTPRSAVFYGVGVLVLIGILDRVELLREGYSQSEFYTTMKHVLCYSLFYVAGYWWYKRLSMSLLLKLAVAFLACYVISRYFYAHDLQVNKFPPNLNFIFYNAFALSVLAIIFTHIKLFPPPLVAIVEQLRLHHLSVSQLLLHPYGLSLGAGCKLCSLARCGALPTDDALSIGLWHRAGLALSKKPTTKSLTLLTHATDAKNLCL